MRRHGWQLPYHPLQVVAVAVFLALGFAFYVFFVPFIGKKLFQFIVIGLYTPLILCVFGLYIWCAATDPADRGVYRSKKYINNEENGEHLNSKEVKNQGDSISSINNPDSVASGKNSLNDGLDTDNVGISATIKVEEDKISHNFCSDLLGRCCFCVQATPRAHEHCTGQQTSEDGMFYCSLCKVEVFKYSKHCRVCDKCIDSFDHHCRWLNNCIGRKNYRRFFTLMVTALLLLVLQWCVGILVLIFCFLERKRYSVEIISKLGSSFSLVPFIVVVASCTILAMLATLPLAQLLCFHVLLIRKGISTYDYIIALREQEQQAGAGGGQQSPQMSPASSLTGMSTASSFNTFNRGAWCTPPRLFLEDQFDVVPPETGTSANVPSKRTVVEDPASKKNTRNVKISPWALARLNGEDVSKAAAQGRRKSKILQPVTRRPSTIEMERDSSYGSSSGKILSRFENRRRANKRGWDPTISLLPAEEMASISKNTAEINAASLAPSSNSSLAPLQLEARSAFRTSRAMSSTGVIASSPESSAGSPDHPFRVSSSGAEEARGLTGNPRVDSMKGIHLSRSTSDGYEASGGEDSDRVPSRAALHRPSDWSSILFGSGRSNKASASFPSSSVQDVYGRP